MDGSEDGNFKGERVGTGLGAILDNREELTLDIILGKILGFRDCPMLGDIVGTREGLVKGTSVTNVVWLFVE